MSALTDMLAEFHAALGDKPGRENFALRITLQDEEHRELIEVLEACGDCAEHEAWGGPRACGAGHGGVSPVLRIGPWCRRCGNAPEWMDGVCSGCWRLLRAVGSDPADAEPVERPTRFDVMRSAGLAHRADEPEFEDELRRWLGEAA